MNNDTANAIIIGLLEVFESDEVETALSSLAQHLDAESLECLISAIRIQGLGIADCAYLVQLADSLEDALI